MDRGAQDRRLFGYSRQGQGQLVHGRADPGDHGALRDHGVRAYRGVPVEMFPTKIRYTSMSLPYHIGNGWFGGMLPLLATAIVAATGDIYAGLWYPIGIAVMTLLVGLVFLKDTKGSISPPAPA